MINYSRLLCMFLLMITQNNSFRKVTFRKKYCSYMRFLPFAPFRAMIIYFPANKHTVIAYNISCITNYARDGH